MTEYPLKDNLTDNDDKFLAKCLKGYRKGNENNQSLAEAEESDP